MSSGSSIELLQLDVVSRLWKLFCSSASSGQQLFRVKGMKTLTRKRDRKEMDAKIKQKGGSA